MDNDQSKQYTYESVVSKMKEIEEDTDDEKDFRKGDIILTHIGQFDREYDLQLFELFVKNIKIFDVKIFMRMIFLDIFFDGNDQIIKEYCDIFNHLIKKLSGNIDKYSEEIMKISDNDDVKIKYMNKTIKILKKMNEIKNDCEINNKYIKKFGAIDNKYINMKLIMITKLITNTKII
jgi:hypothetical protein